MAYNVLSIDFDFYQRVDENTLKNVYPDGEEVGTKISNQKWDKCYKNHPELMNVRINRPLLNKTKSMIKHNTVTDFPCMIAVSHKHILNFIKAHYNEDDDISIFNIDMHHDMFLTDYILEWKNGQPNELWTTGELCCGNWVTYMNNEYPNVTVPWIQHEISRQMFYISMYPYPIISFDDITHIKFDAIFLCRSDEYTPPHLDKYFTEIMQMIQKNSKNVFIQSEIHERPLRHINKDEASFVPK